MDKIPLYIHIGTWKTGSSTIQHQLKHKADHLKSEGIIYLPREDRIVEDYKVIRETEIVDEEFIGQSKERLAKILEVKQRISSPYKLVTSSESFSGDPFKGFRNVVHVAKTLKRITQDFNLDVYIIVYIRRQDDFIESMYTQSIHLGSSDSFAEFVNTFDNLAFNWEYLLDAYADSFGSDNLIVRRYHKKFLPNENSLIHDFGKVIGSNYLKGYQETNSRNRGLTRDALEITRITNKYFDSEERSQLRNIFHQVNSKEPFEKYNFFDNHERNQFLNRFNDSNLNVKYKYITDNSEILFPEPEIVQNYQEYDGLNKDAIVINLTKAILGVNQRLMDKERKLQKEFRDMFFRIRIRNKISLYLNKYPNIKSMAKRLMRVQ